MMSTQNYGNGWGQAARKNANLPTHIKCLVCKRVKSADSYSGKQLDTLLKKMREVKGFDASKMPVITCTMETSKQVVELECFKCDRWMALDKFTKAQRKDPDNAECWECVQERLAEEPHEVGRDDDDGNNSGSGSGGPASSDDDEYDDNLIDGATGSMSNMSVTNGPSTYPSQNGSSTGGRGGVNLSNSTAPTSRPATASNAGTASTARTARSKFDPSKYGGSSKSSGGGAWAKVPAGAPRKTAKKNDSSSDDEDKNVIDDSD